MTVNPPTLKTGQRKDRDTKNARGKTQNEREFLCYTHRCNTNTIIAHVPTPTHSPSEQPKPSAPPLPSLLRRHSSPQQPPPPPHPATTPAHTPLLLSVPRPPNTQVRTCRVLRGCSGRSGGMLCVLFFGGSCRGRARDWRNARWGVVLVVLEEEEESPWFEISDICNVAFPPPSPSPPPP